MEELLLRQDVGLVTLTGAGGTGKTRLALQAAADLLDRFEDGLAFVALAPIREPELVLPTVAAALGVRDAGARPLRDLVLDHVRHRHVLLLLDNFEQVLGAAPLVAEFLASAPRLKVLVTSRAVLRLSGEREYPVPPLTLPDAGRPFPAEVVAQAEAVRLFVERAEAARPDFALDAANAGAVAEICRRLDGLPLAIELAAARVRVLPPRALLARLTGDGGPAALRLLTGGTRDLPERQQTLRAAIDWSYGLLSGEDAVLFRHLGVFVRGCTLGDAEGVVGRALAAAPGPARAAELLQGAEALVGMSLLHLDEDGEGEPRFRMLETVREYAVERLAATGEEEAARRAHAAHYLTLAEAAERALFGAASRGWLDRLEAEHDNCRAALRWALDRGESETALRLSGALWQFWYVRGYLGEGSRWLEEALAGAGLPERGPAGAAGGGATPGAVAVKALNGAGVLAHYQGDYGRAAALCGAGLALARRHGDRVGTAAALDGLAVVARSGGDYTTARTMYQEAIAIQREVGDRAGLAHSLRYLGVLLWAQRDCSAARPLVEQALAVAKEVGDSQHTAGALGLLGYIHHDQGAAATAASFLEESLRLQTELGNQRGMARAIWGLARVADAQGDTALALARFLESAVLFDALGDRFFFANCLDGLAHQALKAAQPQLAARLFGRRAGRARGHRHGTAAPRTGRVRVQPDGGAASAGPGGARGPVRGRPGAVSRPGPRGGAIAERGAAPRRPAGRGGRRGERRGSAEWAGAGGGPPDRPRADQQADRRRADHRRGHRRPARQQHPGQAGIRNARPNRGLGRGARRLSPPAPGPLRGTRYIPRYAFLYMPPGGAAPILGPSPAGVHTTNRRAGSEETMNTNPNAPSSKATPAAPQGTPAPETPAASGPLLTPPTFPVTWNDPQEAGYFWFFDRMHAPEPAPPADAEFFRCAYDHGITAAAAAYELPLRAITRRINTYMYLAQVPLAVPPDDAEARGQRIANRLDEAMAGLGRRWRSEFLPEIQQHLAEWEAFDAANAPLPKLLTQFAESITRTERLYEIHMLIWYPMMTAISSFDDLYRDLFGQNELGDAFGAYRLLQGIENKTVEGGHALWRLGRRAVGLPTVRAVLEERAAADVPAALEQTPEGRDFLADLGRYLAAWGQRGDRWGWSYPTWIEDPTPVIKNLKDYVAQPDRDLDAELAALAAERERLVVAVRERLRGYPRPVTERFEFLLAAAQQANVLTEDHTFWIDFRCMCQVRRVYLELGRRLAAAGVLDQPDDVFLLTPDEVRTTAEALPRMDRRRLAARAARSWRTSAA